MLTKTVVEKILERALMGYDLSPEEGVVLLQQTDPEAIAAIRTTSDTLRHTQAGDTVTYIINRNINFTNICEQHCSFCDFRRDDGDVGASDSPTTHKRGSQIGRGRIPIFTIPLARKLPAPLPLFQDFRFVQKIFFGTVMPSF